MASWFTWAMGRNGFVHPGPLPDPREVKGSCGPGTGTDAALRHDVPAVALASPRSPRSLTSTPRSLLTTPRSLLSAKREQWAAEAAARAELVRRFSGSVRQEELRQLSRRELRQRLLDLGAAPTEGEGLPFAALVDTVLLWNALARLHDGAEFEQREEALLALTDSGLSSELLQRALMVVGVPAEERRGLRPQAAAALLHRRLLPLLEEDEPPCSAQWRRGAAGAAGRAAAKDAPQPVQHLSRWGKTVEAYEQAHEASANTACANELAARDTKFEALDADLSGYLGGAVEIERIVLPDAQVTPPRPKWEEFRVYPAPGKSDGGTGGAPGTADGPLLQGAIDAFIATGTRSSRPLRTPR